MLHCILPIDFVKAFSWPFLRPTNTVIVRKGKFISPLWPWVAVLPKGKEVAGNIQEDPCTPTCQPARELKPPAASGWRTEGRGDAPFTAVSGWTSLASAWVIYACSSSGAQIKPGAPGERTHCPLVGQIRQQPRCWSQEKPGAGREGRKKGRGEGGTLRTAWGVVSSNLYCEQWR